MFDLPKYGKGICLARMAELLDALAIDRAKLQERSVAITGSNGKGSTAAFCASIGRAYGLRTGLFTSPHLFRVNERFQIDGAPIADPALNELVRRIGTTIDTVSRKRREQFGAFEAMFALACLYFQESDCEIMVFEAGIGGRYDPVRLLGSRTTAVASIDYEHVELLGHSLELIVSDKSDACASGGTIVYGENCRHLRAHIIEYNRNRNVESLFVRDEVGISNESIAAAGQSFDFAFRDHHFRSLEVALPGGFQLDNAAIATALFLRWLECARPGGAASRIEAAARAGLRETRWPGRLETIAQAPLTVIDVGHTPDGIRQSLTALKQIYGEGGWILVIG
ncbi:MAG: cyanophycin synthetase, partial [Bradyrhizobium sp.]